ncbi:YesL family protein [Schleiferilactobacillus harbinensis]|jgi:uncharacterized membrane protein YesL|uniref:YesL family protein n=1 Tax=Schleiferilactobacillus harbinensis TaxID=304207 RepID=UPI00242E6099|nr:YesL family protein [Schleiferilactobacillus harbinensis]MCI1688348.1 YesL family protein [Schleiferilactobacillus harbinensis]MCI1784384.1 YesL family protein [Schleiferilactobacillus harbinensis]MCI1851335.1 YesL family protein [Schleiferilactobacillus harbinensis]
MKVFNLNNPVYQTVVKLVDLFYLSVLMLLFATPVLTMGAAFSAGYYTYQKLFSDNEEGGVTHTFWLSFKDNFLGSLPVTIGALVLISVLYVNIQAVDKGLLTIHFMKYVFMGLLILLATYWLLYLCLNARFASTIRQRLITTLSMSLMYLPLTIVLAILVVVAYFVVTIVPITIVLLPAGLVFVANMFCEPVFRRYM